MEGDEKGFFQLRKREALFHLDIVNISETDPELGQLLLAALKNCPIKSP